MVAGYGRGCATQDNRTHAFDIDLEKVDAFEPEGIERDGLNRPLIAGGKPGAAQIAGVDTLEAQKPLAVRKPALMYDDVLQLVRSNIALEDGNRRRTRLERVTLGRAADPAEEDAVVADVRPGVDDDLSRKVELAPHIAE
jgi:hypothetical protein